jgi:hypothetical protein
MTAEALNPSELEQEVARQIAEGMLPSTVERRLVREGHPEETVKRLVEAERQRLDELRRKARSQAAINNARIFALVAIVAGLFLPWSVVSQLDLSTGSPSTNTLNGFSGGNFVYGVVFLGLSVVLLVLLLLTRTRYNSDNTRDRVIFILTTLFEALAAGWWVFAFLAVNRTLADARVNIDLFAGLGPEFGGSARFGMGLFIIPLGVLILLISNYLEIAAVGGTRRLTFKLSD